MSIISIYTAILLLQSGFTEAHPDSLILATHSKLGLWLEQVTSSELILPFLESLIILFGGISFAYMFYKKSLRMQKQDHLQTRALLLATLALIMLSTKGLFFLIGSLSLIDLLPNALFSNIYWLGWQFSMLWFTCFAYLFALSFIRSRKSYDVYFLTGFIFFFIFLTIFYNDTLINRTFFKISAIKESGDSNTTNWVPEFLLSQSLLLGYALYIHITLWVYLFLSTAYTMYKKSKRFRDDSARKASFILTSSFFGIGFLGLISFYLLYIKSPLFTSQSYIIAILVMGLFYFSVKNIYKHGRYKRL